MRHVWKILSQIVMMAKTGLCLTVSIDSSVEEHVITWLISSFIDIINIAVLFTTSVETMTRNRVFLLLCRRQSCFGWKWNGDYLNTNTYGFLSSRIMSTFLKSTTRQWAVRFTSSQRYVFWSYDTKHFHFVIIHVVFTHVVHPMIFKCVVEDIVNPLVEIMIWLWH